MHCPFLRKTKSTTCVFLSKIQKNDPILVFCVFISDRDESRGAQFFDSRFYGSAIIFLTNSVPSKLNLFHPSYCGRWCVKFIGFAYPPYLGRVRWMVGSPKFVFWMYCSFLREMKSTTFVFYPRRKNTNDFFVFLSDHSRPSWVDGCGTDPDPDLWRSSWFLRYSIPLKNYIFSPDVMWSLVR